MAETKEKPKATQQNGVAKTENNNNAVVFGGKTLSIDEAAAMLDSLEVGEKDSSYMELEPGEEKRVVFIGWEQIPGMGDKVGTMVPAASFVTNGKKKQINADAVIVSYFEKQPVGVARRIVCTGLTKSKGGYDYKKFDFFELNQKK